MSLDFQEVRKDEGLKQQYLDSVREFCPESVKAVIYDSDYSKRFAEGEDLVKRKLLDEKDFSGTEKPFS